MLRRLSLASLLVLALGVFSGSGVQAFHSTKLTNGLTVIVEEDRSVELVAIDVWVRAGSGTEPAGKSGIAHMIEHLAFGATSKRSAGQMDLEMESVGATLNARTSRDWAHYSTTVNSQYLDRALEVLQDAVTNPAFEVGDLERERLVILDEIAHKYTDPHAVSRDYLAALLYGEHPYGAPIEGTPESIRALTRDDLVAYHKARYCPANMAVVISGCVDKSEAVNAISRRFGGQPASANAPADTPKVVAPSEQVVRNVKASYRYIYLGYGFLGPAAGDYSDVCAVDVLMTYLGMGYRSWLSTTLKDKLGLAKDVSADYLTHREPGLISITAAVEDSNIQKTKDAISGEIARIKMSGVNAGELELAKRSLLGQYAFENETYAGRATSVSFYFAVSDPGFNAKYTELVNKVTNDDVIRVAKKYLDLERSAVLILGPEEVDPQ